MADTNLITDDEQIAAKQEQEKPDTKVDIEVKASEKTNSNLGKITEILPSKLVLTNKGMKFPNTGNFKIGDTLILENNQVAKKDK